jgi:adenosylcobinamide amidohydrolase
MAGVTDTPPPAAPLAIELDHPWLVVRLRCAHRVLSWAVHRPGLVESDTVAWLQVRNAELGPEVDAAALLAARLAHRGLDHAVGMMTSRAVATHEWRFAEAGGVRADCVATVGLSNACRVAETCRPQPWHAGTINLLARLSVPLSDPAMTEAVSIATAARTAALIAEQAPAQSEHALIGTGTDCVAIATPPGGGEPYAGLHTWIGQTLAAAVYRATRAATRAWFTEHGARGQTMKRL